VFPSGKQTAEGSQKEKGQEDQCKAAINRTHDFGTGLTPTERREYIFFLSR
jgi:hypothetical protein